MPRWDERGLTSVATTVLIVVLVVLAMVGLWYLLAST